MSCDSVWVAGKHKVGFWVGSCGRLFTGKAGPLGEGPGRFERGLFFACFLWGIALLRVRVVLAGLL